MINIKINGVNYEVESNISILQVLRENAIYVPTLCFLKDVSNNASCRLCLVEDKKTGKLITSCSSKTYDGMEIEVGNEKIEESVVDNLKLIINNHNADCDNCLKNNKCELQTLAKKYNIELQKNKVTAIDESLDTIIRDSSKCILCERCSAVCQNIQKIGCIGKSGRGLKSSVGPAYGEQLKNSGCISCGQCTLVCPTGALTEKSEIKRVKEALNSNKHVVVAAAPSTRYGISEELGLEVGTNSYKKLVSGLRKIGFAKVFDLNFSADLTIIEEVNELINKINKGTDFPMFTSCCPSWVQYVEIYNPELKKNLSSSKSPQQMMGSVIKSYYADKNNISRENIFVVMAMPCVAKKVEKHLYDDSVDATLTTREIGNLFRERSLSCANLEDSEFDNPLGEGNSEVFGTSGGVMISALRTFVSLTTGESIKDFPFKKMDNYFGSLEMNYVIKGKEYKFAIMNGIANAKKLINNKDYLNYHFIEVMSCPSGCVNGGGQPIIDFSKNDRKDVVTKRFNAMKETDFLRNENDSKRNINIVNMYKEYFGKPGSNLAEKLLHTKKEH